MLSGGQFGHGQQVGHGGDAIQRGSDLVAHIGQEAGLGLAGLNGGLPGDIGGPGGLGQAPSLGCGQGLRDDQAEAGDKGPVLRPVGARRVRAEDQQPRTCGRQDRGIDAAARKGAQPLAVLPFRHAAIVRGHGGAAAVGDAVEEAAPAPPGADGGRVGGGGADKILAIGLKHQGEVEKQTAAEQIEGSLLQNGGIVFPLQRLDAAQHEVLLAQPFAQRRLDLLGRGQGLAELFRIKIGHAQPKARAETIRLPCRLQLSTMAPCSPKVKAPRKGAPGMAWRIWSTTSSIWSRTCSMQPPQ